MSINTEDAMVAAWQPETAQADREDLEDLAGGEGGEEEEEKKNDEVQDP